MLRHLEKYELHEEIGHGGMATVYRGRDTRLDRQVAVKVLHPHLQKTQEARVRFTREARSAARLKHPNILEIYDYGGEDGDESYIAAELLTGPTVKALVEESAELPAEIAACITLQIARALQCAHESGIVHRDVKPENVMLHEGRVIKLTDFGIAQMVDAQSFTATGQILGSPGHMAPEQVAAGDIDERSDLFSLGTVLYFLAVGRLPFTGRNPHQILKRIVDAEYPHPLRVRPTIGGELASIIERSMEREPDDRYANAEAFASALEEFLRRLDIQDPEALLIEYLADAKGVSERIRQTSIAALTRRGRAALASKDRRLALDCFNRVLSLDEENSEVLDLVDRLGRPDRTRWVIGAAALAALVATGTVMAWPQDEVVQLTTVDVLAGADAGDDAELLEDAERVDANERDAGVRDSDALLDADAAPDTTDDADSPNVAPVKVRIQPMRPTNRRVVFRPTPARVEIAVDDGQFREFGPGFREVELPTGPHRFRIRSLTGCCEPLDLRMTLRPGEGPHVLARRLAFRPALLVVRTNVLPARVVIRPGSGAAGVQGAAGGALRVPLSSASEVRRITVTADGHQDYTSEVRLQAGEARELRANLVPTPP